MMIEFGKWLIRFTNEWTQIGQPMNWYDATVINLSFEYDKSMGQFETRFVLFGLGFYVIRSWETEKRKSLAEEIRKINE